MDFGAGPLGDLGVIQGGSDRARSTLFASFGD
jgi:hypothetical protein